MARRPYRIRQSDNPATYNRVTLPKGALLTPPPTAATPRPGGPSTRAAGTLGAPSGTQPAGPGDRWWEPTTRIAPLPSATAARLAALSPGLSPQANASGNAFIYNVGQTLTNANPQYRTAADYLPQRTQTSPATVRPPERMPRAEQTRAEMGSNYVSPFGSANFNRGQGNITDTIMATSQAVMDQVNAGQLPERVTVQQAGALGYTDALLAAGYTNVGGVLVAPGASVNQTSPYAGGGAGQGQGTLADQLRQQGVARPNVTATRMVHAENANRRNRLSWTDAARRRGRQARITQDERAAQGPATPTQAQPQSMSAIGLVDLNVSTG